MTSGAWSGPALPAPSTAGGGDGGRWSLRPTVVGMVGPEMSEGGPVVGGIAGERLADLLVTSIVDYAIIALDMEGRVATWTPGAERLEGYDADEVLGSHISRFYLPEDVEAAKPDRDLAIAVADGHLEDEGWRVRKDGTRFWANVVISPLFDASGELLGYSKVTRDLTERRRHEEQLRESEERLRLIVDGVKDHAMFLLDLQG
jgi:PAS domain S-box-containing protein